MSGYGAQRFSISSEDFERQSLLKRRRQLSPPRSPSTNKNSSTADGSIGFRRTRSKSKSRAPETTLRRLPSVQGQEFIALGRGDRSRSIATTTTAAAARSSARSPSRGRERERATYTEPEPLPLARRTRSSSKARPVEMQAEAKPSHRERGRSKSKSRKRSHTRRSSSRSSSPSPNRHRKAHSSSSSRSSPKRHRHSESTSVSRSSSKKGEKKRERAAKPSSPPSASVPQVDKKLQDEIDYNEKKLKQAKRELADLEVELKESQRQVDKKNYEISDVTIVLEGLHKRRALQQQFLRSDSFTSDPRSTSASDVAATIRRDPSPELSSRGSRTSKRPCIVDEEEDDEDTESDVEIIERPEPQIKEEVRATTTRPTSASSSSRRSANADPKPAPARGSSSTKTTPAVSAGAQAPPKAVDPMKDHFWGRVDVAKLLVQPRIRNLPDGSARKGRHLEFNPIQQNMFATSSDDGGMIIWNYMHHHQQLSKAVTIDPTSFRKDNQCAESLAWSPDGQRMAIAFRDPIANMGEFAVVRLHDMDIDSTVAIQKLPRHLVKTKSTTLHPRGISAIAWVPGGYGDQQGSRGIVTTGPDHNVVLWEEHKSQTDYKWRTLHHEHSSDVRAICMHSQGNAIYTGGLDGRVIRYDMNTQRTHTLLERRRPQISKINAVLENPHNHNLLLVSSVETNEQNLVLHDLRERHSDKPTMTLSLLRSSDSKSMSQYIVPRWSPGGFHVSCGSTSGVVNIWDVRVRGPKFPVVLPQQSIQVHQKQVLHATWVPRYDAMFSVSNDRTIGLLTFR